MKCAPEYDGHSNFKRLESITATFTYDTAVLTVHDDLAEATHQLQVHLNNIHSWLKKEGV
jgi:hypothetical protein